MKSPLGSKTKTKTKIATAAIAAAGTTTTIDTITERKMENATEGLPSCYLGLLQRILPTNRDNVVIKCDYIQSLKSEINLSDHYRRDVIYLLYKFSFSAYYTNDKSFRGLTREDLLSFLDSFRKIESVDPLNKWIGTYNIYSQFVCLPRYTREVVPT